MVLVACLAASDDDINLERSQFGRKSGEPVELPLGISVFNNEVATLDVTEVTQSLTDGLAVLGIRGQVLPQPAYSSDLGRLLGVRGDRPPNRRAAEEADELSPSHLPPQAGGRLQALWPYLNWITLITADAIAFGVGALRTASGSGSESATTTVPQ